MTPCRLIIDPPAAGAWNMAVDEWLWVWTGRTGQWCLRFYRWQEPTLSLGYFQNHDDRRQHPSSESCPAVRRISGGGAIVHDLEWTYCLTIPLSHSALTQDRGDPGRELSVSVPAGGIRAVQHQWLYEVVHGTIVEILADLGLRATVHHPPPTVHATAAPFLCFQRRALGDVLVGAVKVAGSAQRRNTHALLQHGSLLLARSPAAPELPGLRELVGREFACESVLETWLARLSERLRLNWVPNQLSHSERESISQLVAEKHASRHWVQSRARPTSACSSPPFVSNSR